MAGEFKTIIIGFILFSLFGTMLIMAVNNQASLYGKSTDEVTGGALSFNTFNSTTSTVGTTAQTKLEAFQKQNIFVSLGDILISGFFGLVTGMIQMVVLPLYLATAILSTLGVPDIAINVIIGLVILSIIFAIWKLVKTGD